MCGASEPIVRCYRRHRLTVRSRTLVSGVLQVITARTTSPTSDLWGTAEGEALPQLLFPWVRLGGAWAAPPPPNTKSTVARASVYSGWLELRSAGVEHRSKHKYSRCTAVQHVQKRCRPVALHSAALCRCAAARCRLLCHHAESVDQIYPHTCCCEAVRATLVSRSMWHTYRCLHRCFFICMQLYHSCPAARRAEWSAICRLYFYPHST